MPDSTDDLPPVPQAPYELPASRRRLWVLLAAAAAGTVAWYVLPRGDGSWARVRANGGLRIGYAVDAPLAMVTTAGEVTGEAPETARLVAEILGIGRVDWVQVEQRELLPGLKARRFDMIAASPYPIAGGTTPLRLSSPTLRLPPGGGNGPPREVAFAFHPDDVELQSHWNDAQAQVLGTPRHLAIIASFGFSAADLPPGNTAPASATP
jgi:ABC-type amino acid transport substrate-binding protein